MEARDTQDIRHHELLTVRDVASALGIGLSSTYRLVLEGEIPSFLVPGTRCRRIRSSDFYAWLDQVPVGLREVRR